MQTNQKPENPGNHQQPPFDWSQIKHLTEKQLYQLIPNKSFRFKTKPWHHQLATFVASIIDIEYGCGGFLPALDMGTGKTKVAIDVVRYFWGKEGRVLVVCLNNAVENWCDEVKVHSDLTALAVRGGRGERWKSLTSGEANFKVINFESLRALLTVKNTSARKGAKKTMVDQELVREVIRAIKPNMIVIDESHLIKSPTSLNYQMCNALVGVGVSGYNMCRLELTGTPFGNTPLDVWSQYSLIDFGETFYPTFKEFRDTYFIDKGYYHGWRWQENFIPTKEGREEIHRKIYTHAIRYTEDEVDDLPEKVYKKIPYKFQKTQQKAYDDTIAAIKQAIEDDETGFYVSGADIAEKRLLLRYICSGYIRKAREKEYTRLKQNAKLDTLMETLQEIILSGHKAVVFYEFDPEGEMLIEAIRKKLKVKVAVLSGSVKDKYGEWKRKFQGNKAYRVLVANNAVGSQSINLTEATYCLFYSNSRSVIHRMQAEKRIHRGGQTKRTYFYDFVGRGTVEERIYHILWEHRRGIRTTLSREDKEIYGLGA